MARDQRRLAAIVSADVARYSRLMGEDESRTLAALKVHRRELIALYFERARGGHGTTSLSSCTTPMATSAASQS